MNFVNTTEQEIKHIIRELTVKTARYLNIPDPEIEDSFSLNEQIKKGNERLFHLINEFSTAYMSFYYMVKTICANKKSTSISPTEQAKLQELYDEKEKHKLSILQEIRK